VKQAEKRSAPFNLGRFPEVYDDHITQGRRARLRKSRLAGKLHSFSFADYHDPAHVRFGALRVINEDIVQPGTGFDTHGHRDMEIVTYILSGKLRHRDSMGNGEDIHSGEIQLMRAGSGVQHSEFNPSDSEAVHLLQIWIMPDEQGLAPGYWQKTFRTRQSAGAGACWPRPMRWTAHCASTRTRGYRRRC